MQKIAHHYMQKTMCPFSSWSSFHCLNTLKCVVNLYQLLCTKPPQNSTAFKILICFKYIYCNLQVSQTDQYLTELALRSLFSWVGISKDGWVLMWLGASSYCWLRIIWSRRHPLGQMGPFLQLFCFLEISTNCSKGGGKISKERVEMMKSF